MNHRKLFCTRIQREQMEKSFGGKCYNQIWFVISVSFVFWFFLFYLNSSSLWSTNNEFFSSLNDYVYSVMSRESNSPFVTENGVEPISPSPVSVTDNMSETVNRLPVNGNGIKPVNITRVMENEAEHVKQFDVIENEAEADNKLLVTENRDEPIDELSVKDKKEEHVNQLPVMENGAEPVYQVPVTENEAEPINGLQFKEKGDIENRKESVNELPISETENKAEVETDPCSGRYVYVHNLPSRFNDDMLKECQTLSLWSDMCRLMSNAGLGPLLSNSQRVFSDRSWFATDQFALDVIFNNRMKQYRCLTNNSSLASAIFVPFYTGLDIGRYLWGFNTSMRDSTSLDLVKWLVSRPEWKVLGGRDHFLVAGRITWDFRRLTDKDSDWGNKVMVLPEAKNMSMLVIESSPWHSNDFAIPYPTYFHPSRDSEVFEWQNRMRRQKKRYLFSFAGAPRPNLPESIRDQIIDQCRTSRRKCKLLECNKGGDKCHNPSNVMKIFQSSIFCLQPPGDSYTRRSAFDSILAGCIPVFFHPGSAYVQYTWHLPQNHTKYSVFISENDVRYGKVSIERRLLKISKEEVKAKREEVIRLIPRLIYADPRSKLETLEDAFDIAVGGVIENVKRVRREMKEGRISAMAYEEQNSWKYNLFGTVKEHEWDPFFSKPKEANS